MIVSTFLLLGLGFAPPSFDTTPPELPADLKPGGVLIFSKTNGYRDEPALQASNAALAAIAKEKGWPYFITENGAVMNPGLLSKFRLVIWNNASGDVLTPEQREIFKTWMENGGSYFGIHGAGGDPVDNHGRTSLADWKWYVETLVGAQFIVHSSIQPGDIHIEDAKSPLAKNLPAMWHRSEEWYAFAENPRKQKGFHIIATVDEKSYNPGKATMGADHPLVWWHCVGKGRAVYSALGHAGRFYSEALMIQLLENAMGFGLQAHACPA
jgi:type 1 glutamine amidotransferase